MRALGAMIATSVIAFRYVIGAWQAIKASVLLGLVESLRCC
jgi:hypothetical protein